MPEQEKIVISERDKPFILALIASVLFACIVAVGFYGAYTKADGLVEFAKWAGTSVFGLMSMAWTYYLNKKNGG
jgi:hypothetical protein